MPRVVVEEDLQLGEWTFPKGSIIGLPSRSGAMNKSFWNAGKKDNPHPVEGFWEERFLIYPNDPRSGPLRKQKGLPLSTEQKPKKRPSTLERSSEEPMFSLKGLKSVYTPFGNGPGMCPGRHFAKQKVVCTLAILALYFDIEIQSPKGWEPKMDTSFFLTGALPPKDKVRFRIRRRV
jgi:cytochrome P450